MIHVVILEKDRMVSSLLKEILQGMRGFQIENIVEDIQQLSICKADLIIGEISDEKYSFPEWILTQRAASKSIDFIPVTSNHNYSVYCQLIRLGALDYILKPFDKSRLKTSLLRYQKWKARVVPDKEVLQSDIDVFHYPGILQEETGISPHTYERIRKYISNSKERWFTSKEAALEMKMSPVTMRRYLEVMYQQGYLLIETQYGKIGRPVYRYCIKKQEENYGYDDCSNSEQR